MSTLDELTSGISRAWDHLADGWRDLVTRANHALTRFTPGNGSREVEVHEAGRLRSAPRWGLLAAEVKDAAKEVVVKLEAPGMEPNDFEIHVHGEILVVAGEKHFEREEHRGRYSVTERAFGRFERAIPLPCPVDESQAKAEYRRGVLHIALAKTQPAIARRIDVTRA